MLGAQDVLLSRSIVLLHFGHPIMLMMLACASLTAKYEGKFNIDTV